MVCLLDLFDREPPMLNVSRRIPDATWTAIPTTRASQLLTVLLQPDQSIFLPACKLATNILQHLYCVAQLAHDSLRDRLKSAGNHLKVYPADTLSYTNDPFYKDRQVLCGQTLNEELLNISTFVTHIWRLTSRSTNVDSSSCCSQLKL